MNRRFSRVVAATWILAMTLLGCAGGWKNGPPPGRDPVAGARDDAPQLRGIEPTRREAGAQGVTFVWKGGGNQVHLAGEFNSWSTTADPMVRQADGAWTLTKKLDPGRYQYKFVIDGGTWKEDPASGEYADDGYGGRNSVVVVGSGAGRVSEAPPTPDAGPRATGRPPDVTPDGVTFVYAGAARTVHLAGAFNGWSTTADPMTRQADGTWTITVKLPAGSHPYKFVVDGTTWKQDTANPAATDDGFGGKNSVVVVP